MRITSIGRRVLAAGMTCGALAVVSFAQTAASTDYAITHAKIFTLAGAPIEDGTVVIHGGKIAAVGASVSVPAGAKVIDAKGLQVYPGLFDPVTQMGLSEIAAVRATVDSTETGPFNPDAVAATAVFPSGTHIPVTRAAGITEVLAVPASGGFDSGGASSLVGGQASAFYLAGWTMDDMAIRRNAAMVIDWPRIETQSFDFSTFTRKEKPYTDAKKEYDKQVEQLADWFEQARHYAQALDKAGSGSFERDVKLEAMAPVVRGDMPVLVFADRAHDIRDAVEFCDKQKVRMILAGGEEASKVKDLLRSKAVPVILRPTLGEPAEEDDAYDRLMTQPSELQEAGVKFAFGSFDNSFARRLGQQAANAVAHGLAYEEGLKAVTLYPAQIFGLDGQLGTIESGKVASLIVTTGDPLELTTEVKYLFIKGQLTSTDNRQKDLYQKFAGRPKTGHEHQFRPAEATFLGKLRIYISRTMRRPITALLLLAFALCLVPRLAAQDAQKILDQYKKAAGGGKTLDHLQTLSLDGTIRAERDQNPGTYTFKVKQPNRYYVEIRKEGKTLIEAYNGKSSWHETEGGTISTLLGDEALQMEAAGQYYNTRLVALSKKKIGAAYKCTAQVRGHEAQEVTLTFPTGVQWEVYFDPQTHLIVEDRATIAGIPHEIYYGDYRSVNGLKVPYKIEVHRGNDVYDINVTQAAANETVGERVFDFPKKSQVQLPDLKKLFEEIDANQKQIDKLKENYAATRVEEETEYDKTGKVSKKDVKEYTFFYLNGDEISTLVKKDGKALSDEEQKKENEKTAKHIEEAQKEAKKKEEKEQKAKEEGKDKKDDDPGIEVFLRVSQFVNPRRERFRGQDVLVFDFEPNPEHKPKNIEEKVVKDLAGVVWVDEKAHDVVRLEAYFVNDMRFAGGMVANLQKGTSFVFEQAFVNGEVWLPTYMEAHIGVRVLLVKGFKVNVAERYSDYKRFNVETLNTINKPKQVSTATDKPQ